MRKQTPIEPTWLHKLLDKNPGEIPEIVLASSTICGTDRCHKLITFMNIGIIVLCGFIYSCFYDIDFNTVFEEMDKDKPPFKFVLIAMGFSFVFIYCDSVMNEKVFKHPRTVERKMRAKLRRGEVELLPENK